MKQPGSLDEALAIIESQRAEIDSLTDEIKRLKKEGASVAPQRFSVKHLLQDAFRSARGNRNVELLEQSPFFSFDYYSAQVGAGKPFRNARQAIRHYLKVGATAGLNPSEVFDTRWYLAKYPDVGVSGYNPLVHFVLYGLSEGRFPGPDGLTGQYLVRKEPVNTQELRLKLWGGFPHLTLPQLIRLADQNLDQQAAWALAAWYYAHGDYESALYRVVQYEKANRLGLDKRSFVALAKCYAQLGQEAECRLLVERGRQLGLDSIDFPYVSANAAMMEHNFDKAIMAFNQVYTRAGLASVEIDSSAHSQESPLARLKASSMPSALPEQPLVSVVIPAYNAATTLPIALQSLLAQSWKNLEIIIIDDCSQDHTQSVVNGFADIDNRVRYLKNEKNLGAYPTRNRGMAETKGEFVTVHDSDDWSHPQKIERQMQPLLVDSSKVATYSAWVRVTEDMLFVGPWLLSESFIEKNHSSLLVRASVLREVGAWDSVNVAGDTEFLWRLETCYGAESILSVLPTTPMSLALADDNSLTRTKASHVKTIHYGLRRLYREAARWWHRQSETKVTMKAGERPFPLPLGIARGTPREFDEVWVANFGDMDVSDLLNTLESTVISGTTVCLMHWPDYLGWYKTPVNDEVFEFCSRQGVCFAHHGLEVQAPTVVIASNVPLSYPPAQTVRVTGLRDVRFIGGGSAEDSAWLTDYFTSGGVLSSEQNH